MKIVSLPCTFVFRLRGILLCLSLSLFSPLSAQVPNKAFEMEDFGCVEAIREIAFDLFADEENPDQVKVLKAFFREADMDQLSDFVENVERDESEEKMFAVENYPFIYYAWLGAWYECVENDESKIYRYYTVALKLLKEHEVVAEEAVLLKEFKRIVERHPIEGLKSVLERSR
ncbi:hypothetical protein [Runella sp.]|uniref:hypothetical protein n=1 Tax=Runella sp. TaxID=1960881 RepID=UPI0030185856